MLMIATIAVIDDDDAVRDSTRALLECNDYAVREHASAEDFLGQVRDDVDCVLVDHNMPGMTGLELLERLRAEGDQIPALMMTGRADPTMEPRAKLVGAKLLHKPICEDHLVHSIETVRRNRIKPAAEK
jgi:two-component system, LuxR family, response regulator FixJ